MLILRVVGLLLLLSIAVCLGATLLTGKRHYLQWAGLLAKIALAVVVVFMALLLLERLLVPLI